MRVDQAAASCVDVSRTHLAASGPVPAVQQISMEVPAGAITVLLGPSGSGKSTLLGLLACVDRPDSGQVWLAGVNVTAQSDRARRGLRRKAIGYVFSRPSDNLLPYLRAAEQLELAADLRGVPRATAAGLLDRLGLAGRERARPDDLSGGERSRLAFAAAAVGSPALLVADEPTAELDAASAASLVDVLREVASQGSGVLVATHDPRLLPAADHVVRLRAGRVQP